MHGDTFSSIERSIHLIRLWLVISIMSILPYKWSRLYGIKWKTNAMDDKKFFVCFYSF